MHVDTGHLFESLEAAARKGVDLRRLIMIPGPLIEEAKNELAGKAETIVPLDGKTPLGEWAKQHRKGKLERLREKRKARRKMAKASQRKNRQYS